MKTNDILNLSEEPFLLGDYEVDPKALRIGRAEQSVKIEFKVMQVLLLLANDAGEVVSRRTLESTLWAGRIVTEDAVTNAVGKLRRAFGDSARAPSYIETVPKLGYRLMRKPQPKSSKKAPRPLSNPLGRIYLAGALAIAVIVAILLGRLSENEAGAPEPAPVAVLPSEIPSGGRDESVFVVRKGAADTLAAYDEFSLGLASYLRMTPDDIETARNHYLRAIELDPNFARAYGGAALTWAREVMDGWASNPDRSIQEASRYVSVAEQVDPDVPQIYFVKGLVALFQGQHLAAAEAAHQATQLDPNYADAYGLLAWVLHLGGRPDVAAEALHEAVRLKPESSASFEVIAGEIHFASGRYNEAVACFSNALERNPAHSRARLWLSASLVQTGQLDDARWELDELLAQNPNFSFENSTYGIPQKDPELLSRFFRAIGQVRRVN